MISKSGTTDHSAYEYYDYWQYDKSAGVTRLWEHQNLIKVMDTKCFQGFSIPGFHRRVRKGELLPHTPWSSETFNCTRSGSIGPLSAVVSGSDIDTWWSTGNYPMVTSWPTSQELHDLVPSDAYALVQAAAAQIVGESHDTLTFMAELASTKKMFLDAGRRFLKKEIPRNWRKLSNDWLSYRYGWRTFMYDCQDIHKAIKRLDKERKRYSKRSKSINTWSTSQNIVSQPLLSGTTFQCSRVISTEYEVSVVGTVNADISLPIFSFNPVVTAWEVVPYSFVVDWFLGVGQAITALTFLAMQRSYAASWGCKVTINRTDSVSGYSIKSGVTGTCQGTGNGEASLEVRVPCSVPITPQLAFKIDVSKVIDLLALVRQRL